MLNVVLGPFGQHTVVALPVAQQEVTISLSGIALLLAFMIIGGYVGYQQGFRNMLTLTLWSIIAYITCVQGGEFIVELINRIWQNGPRFFAFLIGNDPSTVPQLDPLINPDFQVPLFFRFIAFLGLILLGWFFNKKAAWRGNTKEALLRPLGIFAGALVALLWTNAAVVFWNAFLATGGSIGGPVAQVLNTLPDVSILMPSLIAVFFIILGVLVVFYFPKVWKP